MYPTLNERKAVPGLEIGAAYDFPIRIRVDTQALNLEEEHLNKNQFGLAEEFANKQARLKQIYADYQAANPDKKFLDKDGPEMAEVHQIHNWCDGTVVSACIGDIINGSGNVFNGSQAIEPFQGWLDLHFERLRSHLMGPFGVGVAVTTQQGIIPELDPLTVAPIEALAPLRRRGFRMFLKCAIIGYAPVSGEFSIHTFFRMDAYLCSPGPASEWREIGGKIVALNLPLHSHIFGLAMGPETVFEPIAKVA